MYNHGRNIWRFTYLFQHNEFHAWSAANHAKVITGTQITAASRVKMNVSADLLRRLPTESMTQLCHVVADVKLKNKKKKERKRKKKKERKEKERKKEWKNTETNFRARYIISRSFNSFSRYSKFIDILFSTKKNFRI